MSKTNVGANLVFALRTKTGLKPMFENELETFASKEKQIITIIRKISPMPNKIFISHATADDNFVTQLRKALEYKGLDVWIDSQNLRGGDILKTEIESAIKDASAFIVVISNNTFDSIIVNRGVLQVSKEAYMLSSRQIHNLNFFL